MLVSGRFDEPVHDHGQGGRWSAATLTNLCMITPETAGG
jgi:hypothetical protein